MPLRSRFFYLPLVIGVLAGTATTGRAETPTVELRKGPEHILAPAPKGYRVALTKAGEARLIRGGKVLQFATPRQSRSLPKGMALNQKKQLTRHGKEVAKLNLDHDLDDDAFWGARQHANKLRYHQGRGGVYPEVTTVLPESRDTAILVVSWRSVSLSANAPLIHQVVRLRQSYPITATVLVSFDAEYGTLIGEWACLFIHEGKVFIYSGETLRQLVRAAKG